MPGGPDVFDALADPHRRTLIDFLARHETATASELAAQLPVTRQAAAKHLGKLHAAGLVERRREGRATRYQLSPEPLGDVMEWVMRVGAAWDDRLAALQRYLERSRASGTPNQRP